MGQSKRVRAILYGSTGRKSFMETDRRNQSGHWSFFYHHNYGNNEKGLAKYISDREIMFGYMRAIFKVCVKSRTVLEWRGINDICD
ncbi:MAG: hypothetical protein ACI4KR_07995 [Ruminiclostridium sp.]